MNKGNPKKSPAAEREERVLDFWNKKKIFEKSLKKNAKSKEYVFYDGPPFATGAPHYGHILASTIKDAVPRYQTMRGLKVSRRWGWDCHGLPIENIVEKDLKISGRKQIENFGVGKFNEYARSKVLAYVHEWKKTVERMGRWVDFEGSYKTMDNAFIESVWWALKEINKKGLIYEGTRVLPYCPRCETPIANSEIAMDSSYKDITDISVYAKFELEEKTAGQKVYVLAWTTTPWTLPGNFALAVNPKITYVQISIQGEKYILAKDRLPAIKKEYQIEKEFSGQELIGKSYKPLFDYFSKTDFENKDKAWKIYGADFVTTSDGTGVVHAAPGYGEDDMNLAKKENIPFIHHVGPDGKFNEKVGDLSGIPVKPKEDHQSADILILKKLAEAGKLFDKEKITHSYPHCYRCETPLYYYAIPAWFIKISEVKKKLLDSNKKINWVPAHLKEGRYGKSLEGAPDWNISRNRFWASPLPVWKCSACQKIEFVGSLEEFKEKSSRKNKYFVMRHGQAENNVEKIASGDPKIEHHLTDKGRKQTEKATEKLKKEKIDLIFVSPHARTKETAFIVAGKLGLDKKIVEDRRLAEPNMGDFNGKNFGLYINSFASLEERFSKEISGVENYSQVKNRIGDFLYEAERENEGKNILIVTHEVPAWLAFSVAEGSDVEVAVRERGDKDFLNNAEIRKLPFAPIPHNKNYELDFHRPYADEIVFPCPCGKGQMKRISEVIDCWFESGSMPFASIHYPFEDGKWFKNHFPADFVAEYIAQTRTWFYYSHVVSEILFASIPFKNIVTTGTILAEDGQKMSKSKGNFPDPWIIFEKYGVDALRFYLLSSPVMKTEDLYFSEKDVDAVFKKVISRLDNVVSFYELYKSQSKGASKVVKSSNVLDKWIMTRLKELVFEVTDSMENYEISKALDPIEKFVDDLSTWYLRRSRERFKDESKDRQAAISTTKTVLENLAKIMAPFTPFIAEDIYQKIGDKKMAESVHLETWPKISKLSKTEKEILEKMKTARKIVEIGLSERAAKAVKVRQPLTEARYEISGAKNGIGKDFEKIVAEELNVKKVVFGKVVEAAPAAGAADSSTEKETPGLIKVWLDFNITAELKEEGDVREILRAIQDLRKKEKLNPKDRIILSVETDEKGKILIEKFKTEISKTAGIKKLIFNSALSGEPLVLGGSQFKFKLAK